MRTLGTHKVGGVNDGLRVLVLDEPGAGGACARYVVEQDIPDNMESTMRRCMIDFQSGPMTDGNPNGVTNEALLSVLQDRLEGFQQGSFPSELNEIALGHVREALAALQQRTRDRIARGVEGKNVE